MLERVPANYGRVSWWSSRTPKPVPITMANSKRFSTLFAAGHACGGVIMEFSGEAGPGDFIYVPPFVPTGRSTPFPINYAKPSLFAADRSRSWSISTSKVPRIPVWATARFPSIPNLAGSITRNSFRYSALTPDEMEASTPRDAVRSHYSSGIDGQIRQQRHASKMTRRTFFTTMASAQVRCTIAAYTVGICTFLKDAVTTAQISGAVFVFQQNGKGSWQKP